MKNLTQTLRQTVIVPSFRLAMLLALSGLMSLAAQAQEATESSPETENRAEPSAEPLEAEKDKSTQPLPEPGTAPGFDLKPSPSPEPSKKEKKAKDETLRIRGRLQGGWQLTADSNTGSFSDNFYLRRARIDGRWTPLDWAKVVLEIQLSLNGVEARDVYGQIKLNSWLDLTLGHFKKPFSRLRMMSPYDLVIPQRGLLDENAVANTKYGGFGARDIGMMLSGDVEGPTLYQDPLKFTYALGAFNNLPTESNYHRDIVARAQLRLFKGLVVAANSSFKFYEESSNLKSVALYGGDIKWELDPFRLQIEGAFGDNVNTNTRLWGAHALASYDIALSPLAELAPWAAEWTLVPALMFEVFDPDVAANDDMDLRLAAALNLDINPQVRLTLGVDKVWADITATNSALPDPIRVQLQTQLRF